MRKRTSRKRLPSHIIETSESILLLEILLPKPSTVTCNHSSQKRWITIKNLARRELSELRKT